MLDVNDTTNISAMKIFLSNTGKLIKNGGKSLDSIFQNADKNKNGKLDKNEVSTVLKDWKMDSIYDTNSVMHCIDNDKDGKISFTEITDYASSLGVKLNGKNSLISSLFDIANLGGGLRDVISNVLS